MKTTTIKRSPVSYVTIRYSDHDYTATVRSFGQLSNYLSLENRKFTIGDVKGDVPAWLLRELSMVSRFTLCQNTTSVI